MDIKFLERYLPEGIPFPFSRSYSIVARSRIFRDFYRQVAEEVALRLNEGRILDVGTGPGYLPIEIAKLVEKAEIIGIDLSEDMIRIARRNAEKESVKVKFLVMDANNMSFEDSYFDLVLSTGSLHHWKKPLKVISEMRRVLKESGEAWIYDLRKDAPDELIANKLREYGYGKLTRSVIFRMVKLHSGISLEEMVEIGEKAKEIFRNCSIEESWHSFPVMKLRLCI